MYSIVACVAVMNYFGIISVPPLYPEIYPTSTYELDLVTGNMHGRGSESFGIIPRLNLMLGGALGSAASVISALGLISILLKKELKLGNLKAAISFCVLMIASALTLSYSMLLPCVFVILIALINIKYSRLLFPILSGGLLIVLSEFNLADKSLYSYVGEVVSGVLNNFNGLSGLLLGKGATISSSAINQMQDITSSSGTGDVGPFRVLFEQGIICFTLFAIMLLRIFKKLILSRLKDINGLHFGCALLIFSLLLGIHTNMILVAPFFPLFAIAVAGLCSSEN